MGSFGGETQKPLRIVSSSPAITLLKSKRPKGTTNRLTTQDGKKFSGKKREVSASQAYSAFHLRRDKFGCSWRCLQRKDTKHLSRNLLRGVVVDF